MRADILHVLYLLAIAAEAMSGAILAMQRGMDRFGLALVGVVTALGGGSIRDVLLGHHPLVWIATPQYLLVTIAAATLASFTVRHIHRLRTTFLTVDAIGLVIFTVLGCDVGMNVSDSPIIVALAGIATGIGGGILRDLLCGAIPLVLRREMYASVAGITSIVYLGSLSCGLGSAAATALSCAIGFAMRMGAIRFGWHLKTFEGEAPTESM